MVGSGDRSFDKSIFTQLLLWERRVQSCVGSHLERAMGRRWTAVPLNTGIACRRSLMTASQMEQELACSTGSCAMMADETMELLDKCAPPRPPAPCPSPFRNA